MSSILFWDPSCVRPYDTQSILREASGGTESSVARIADALDAWVVQHNRTTAEGRYLPPGRIPGISHVVLVRDSRALSTVRANSIQRPSMSCGCTIRSKRVRHAVGALRERPR
jgi:hypothetical protein